MKKNVLYTITKGNRPAFMPDMNLFDDGGNTWDNLAKDFWGTKTWNRAGTTGTQSALIDAYKNSSGNNWFGISKGKNPFSKGNIGNTLKGIGGAAAGIAAGIGVNENNKRGLYDRLDPLHQLAGGKETGLGNGLGDLGVGLFEAGAQSGNGWLMLAGGIAKGVGSAYNAAMGVKLNDDLIKNIKNNASRMKEAGNALAQASTNAGVMDAARNMGSSMSFNYKDLGSTGFLRTNNRLKREENRLNKEQNSGLATQTQGLMMGATQADQTMDDLINQNFVYSYGGPLNPYGGALGLMQNDNYINAINNRSTAIMKANPFNTPSNAFGEGGGIHISPSKKGTFTAAASRHGMGVQEFASKVLANKDDYSPAMVKKANFARNAAKWHAFGGELGTNGTDWTNGLLFVDGGGTHQQNPLGGVPVGFDANGTPNLVEEGETIWNDYVFSNRIKVPKAMFHTLGLGGAMKKGLTFADASKKLAKESEQRPNDPISMAGLDASLSKLAAVQEAERMKKQMREYVGFGNMAAFGGPVNRFEDGGSAWLAENHPELSEKNRKALASYMESLKRNNPNYSWYDIYTGLKKKSNNDIINTVNALYKAGMDEDAAFELAYNKKLIANMGADKMALKNNIFSNLQRESIAEEPVNVSSQDIQNAWDDVLMGYTSGNNTVVVPTVEGSPSVPEATFSAPIDSYNLDNMIMQAQNPTYKYQQPSSQIVGNSGTRSSAGSGRRGPTGLLKYDRYLNGSDGVGTPTGFTVDANGKVLEYTPEYIEKAKKLTAADVRNWVAAHPDDVSYLSFRDKGNNLDTLTDDQASRGAIDGDYGFLHHVVDSMLQEQKAKAAQETPDVTPYQNTPAYAGVSPAEKGIDDAERETAAVPANEDTEALADTNNTKTTPVDDKRPMLDTRLRYAPVWGSALSVLSDMFNTPDYTYPDKLEAVANAAANTPVVNAQPIGDYMRYSPFDRLFYANQLQANARATDRALGNTASPSAAAGVLANAYNTNNSLGNLYRQAEEYNLAQRQQTADFNRRTNMFNSQMGLEAALANARNRMTGRGQQMQGLAQVAALRDAIDRQYSASRSANLTNFFNNLGNIGRENFIFNQINSDPSRAYGYNTPWTGEVGYWPKFMEDQYKKWYDEQEKKKASQVASATTGSTTATSGAYGGKLKRNKK